jgi:type I restriction enzyme, S subunit
VSLNLDKSLWKCVAFGDVIENITDRVDNPSEAGVDRYVGLEHLDPGAMTVYRWDTPDKVEAQKLRFRPGDVIFGRRRAYQKKVALAEFEGICSAHALVLRARPGYVNPDFLPVFLSSDYFLDRAIAISVGSLSPTVNWRDLKVQEFDLPPLDEQKRIADLLWAIERHRVSLRNVPHALAIGYDAWLGDRLRSYPTVPLDDVVDLQHGRPVPSSLYRKGEFPLLRPGDMNSDGSASWSSTSVSIPQEFADRNTAWILSPGDLVINMTAQTLEDRFLGRVCRMHDRALLNQRIGRLTTRARVTLDFTFVALHSAAFAEWVSRKSEGSKVKHMHWRHIADYPIPAPSPDDQTAIVLEAARWRGATSASVAEYTSLGVLRSSLLADIFGDN